MKNLLIIICLAISGSLFGQAEKALIKSVQAANWDEATSYLKDRVDYCIDDDQDYMKKADCIANLKNMIEEHGVTAWKEVHKGQSKDGSSWFCVYYHSSLSQLDGIETSVISKVYKIKRGWSNDHPLFCLF